jgi:dimethylamine corrinoid protein
MSDKIAFLKALENCVIEMEDEKVAEVAQAYLAANFDAAEGIEMGLCKGMEQVGVLFDEEEYYIPELLICSDAMYAGIGVLEPHIVKKEGNRVLKAVVGVVEGDTHDIGKNIFKIMLQANGFEVYDLGRDVPCERFVEKAKEVGAHLVGMSTLMTTTMDNMSAVIELLKTADIRQNTIVMVGGGPVSRSFSELIGADGYEREASAAAKLAKRLVAEKLKASQKC